MGYGQKWALMGIIPQTMSLSDDISLATSIAFVIRITVDIVECCN